MQDQNVAVIAAHGGCYAFKLEGSDKVWRIPLAGSLPLKKARRLAAMVDSANASEIEQLDAVIALFDDLCPGLTDEVRSDQLKEIMEGWSAASGIEPGESRGSAD